MFEPGRVLVRLVLFVGVVEELEDFVRDVRCGKLLLFFFVMDETDDIEELLAGELNLFAKDFLLQEDHDLGAAPHIRGE